MTAKILREFTWSYGHKVTITSSPREGDSSTDYRVVAWVDGRAIYEDSWFHGTGLDHDDVTKDNFTVSIGKASGAAQRWINRMYK
jgi:hypothetical protein